MDNNMIPFTEVAKDTPGVIWIGRRAIAENQAAFDEVLRLFTEAGAEAEPTEGHGRKGSVHLSPDSDKCCFVRCKHCSALTTRIGSKARRGARCTNCSAIIYYELLPGTEARLSLPDPAGATGATCTVRFTVVDYRPTTNQLLLATAPIRPGHMDCENKRHLAQWDKNVAAAKALAQVVATERVTTCTSIENGQLVATPITPVDCYVVPFNRDEPARQDALEVEFDRAGRIYSRQTDVMVWAGKEYDLSFRPTISITLVPGWQHFPLAPSPDLHNQILAEADCTSHSFLLELFSRGAAPRLTFTNAHLARIRLVVERLTTLDLTAYDRLAESFEGKHPSEVMLDLAAFCHAAPIIRKEYSGGAYYTCILPDARKFVASQLANHVGVGKGSSMRAALLEGLISGQLPVRDPSEARGQAARRVPRS